MKKIIFLSIFNLIFFCGYSEYKQNTYISCLDENPEWSIIYQNEYPLNYIFETSGEIIIDGMKYARVKDFAIRQNETNSKLYFRQVPDFYYDEKEYLVMDLDLEVGDTFDLPYLHLWDLKDTVTVESIYYIDGRKVIEFDETVPNYISSKIEKFKFIEGVGSNMGFTYPSERFPRPYLLCYTNNTYHYSNPFSASCRYVYGGLADIHPNSYEIENYSDRVIIHFKNKAEYKFSLYSVSGQCIYTCKSTQNSSITIQVSQPGIYFIRLEDIITGKNGVIKMIK